MSVQKSTKSSRSGQPTIERCGYPATLAAIVGGGGDMRKFALLVAVAVACGPAVSETGGLNRDYSDTPAFGGNGGGAFLAYCPEHTYLIGIGGRTGNWIDAIQPICAQWNSTAQAFNPPVTGRMSGGSGGGPATLMCPAGMAVRGWEIATTATGNTLVVRYVRPQCETVLPEQRPGAEIPGQFGGSGAAAPADRMGYKCPPGQLANGIYGTSGAFVDRAGLKCVAQPFILGRPVPFPEPAKSIGRVPSASGPPGPVRSICEAARDARARNSPAAPNLEAQCRASEPVKSIGRVPGTSGSGGPVRSICEAARDARARNSPAARNLEAQCRAAGESPPPSTPGPAGQPSRPIGVTYNSPMIVAANGDTVMLDFCRDFGSACGKPAADAFCQQKGHPNASRFQISEHIGRTAIISTGAICDDPSCDGFTKIQCNPDPE